MSRKNVQIPAELFFLLIQDYLLEMTDAADEERIKELLTAKLDSIVKHDLYTKSKTAETEEEREEARKKYLDQVGMHPDWRW